ncbi:DUF317 domain-containing protein [Kitasatospora sp. Root107]|uniref:DUF317 domain-containing protein n=1 Tax=Kitasatospora sp. Root107 TaxID=1736424 RepID=UPI0035119705
MQLTGSPHHAQWRLSGRDANGTRWRAWFDQSTPAHLIKAACHQLTAERTCAYLQDLADDAHDGVAATDD